MPPEPHVKRAIAFFDGQNLFHSVKDAFGYTFPNYDPKKLAFEVCRLKGWVLHETRFYTGIPAQPKDPFWHYFWSTKLGVFNKRKQTVVYTRPLRYMQKDVPSPGGGTQTVTVADEKGIDVRIAIDIISLAFTQAYDVALVFSQDQDLSEVADEIRKISAMQGRWLKIASAFPGNQPGNPRNRGINRTDWVPFNKVFYDLCIDPRDYRPSLQKP